MKEKSANYMSGDKNKYAKKCGVKLFNGANQILD